MTRQATGVGIDVSKAKVDVAVHGGGRLGTFPRTVAGLEGLCDALSEVCVHRVVLEASGGYEGLVLSVLSAAKLPLVLVQPVRARHFARALNQYAKTDALDAAVLAHMATVAVDSEPLWRPADPQVQKLRELVDRRLQLVDMLGAETKRKRHVSGAAAKSIERVRKVLSRELAKVEAAIDETIEASEDLAHQDEVLQSVRGVGRNTTAALLAHLPELGRLDRRAIASLAGLAPVNRDSGTKNGKRYVRGGRRKVRSALYMAALASTKWNAHLKAFYERLVGRGKPGKVALIAVAHKLLLHLNSLMREVLSRPARAAA